ncbi:MAG: hypothetical protein ACLR2K_01810 [Paraclostridium sordellii]
MIKLIKGITTGIVVANDLFDLKNNIKREEGLKLDYNLIYTGGTIWTKFGGYKETNEISLSRLELDQGKFLSYPMGDNKHLKVSAKGSHEPYHLFIKNDSEETINNILIKISFENLVMVKQKSYNDYNWIYEYYDGYLGAYRGMKLIIDKLLRDDYLVIPFNIKSHDLYANSHIAKMSVDISADKCNKISHEYPIIICNFSDK